MINESNLTSHSSPTIEWFPGLQLFASIFYTLIIVVGVMGNTLVIIIIMKFQDMKSATNLLLMNLSVADVFFLIFCSPDGYQHLYGKDKHRLGNFMCRFSPFVQNATGICSVLTIMAISYERYVAICQPLKASSLHLTVFRTLPTVICFWFLSCFISVPFFIFTNTYLVQSTYGETIVTCFTNFPSFWSTWYLILCTFIIYLIILILLCYWHYSICYILFNREALLRDNTIVTRYRRQVAQLLIALIASFFILILPYKIWAIIQQQLSVEQFHRIGFPKHSLLIITTRSLLYLNSAINPLLYSIMSTKFRQCFLRLLSAYRKSSKNSQASAVLFCKEYAMRPMLIGGNRFDFDQTISPTGHLSYPQGNIHLNQERKLLLGDNTPASAMNVDTPKFIF